MITQTPVRQSPSLVSDLCVAVLLAALLYGLVQVSRQWQAPLVTQAQIHLSLWALPGYTLLSLLRGFMAYGISLAFTLIYGYTAAHQSRAERFMIPLLDIFQSIPVLGFLPGAVFALVALFPRTNVGLELACILMIFTGQVWNMTFSFYQSLRNIPLPLKEASSVYQFNGWQRFRYVELPASAVALTWNSMMSMAGGWFFLMVCEAFTLGDRDFRLPGLGAYMSVAISHHNVTAILGGVGAMILMIVLVDSFVWKPLIAWSQKFRLEETSNPVAQHSFILTWLRDSRLVQEVIRPPLHQISERLARVRTRSEPPQQTVAQKSKSWTKPLRLFSWAVMGAGALAALWAAFRLLYLLGSLNPAEWWSVLVSAVFTFIRVMAATLIGSLWAVPVGIWIGGSDRRRQFLQPLVQIAASFPAPMLYPLVLLILNRLGSSLAFGSAVLMLLGTQWYVLFNVIAGASVVPGELREAADAYRFTSWQRWRNVWLPAVFPYLVTGWLTAAGGAWNASIVAEYVSFKGRVLVTRGLGSLISMSASQGHYALLAAGVLIMAVTVVLINRFLWKPLYRLAEERYAY